MKKKALSWLDNIGFFLSMLCAIHCLFFPIFLVILPLLGMVFLLNETAEKAFVIGSVLMAAFSLIWGYSMHKKKIPLLVYLAGASMLLTATFLLSHSHAHVEVHQESEHVHEHETAHQESIQNRPQGNPLSLLLLVLGGVSIASSHYLNKKMCSSCPAHRSLPEVSR